MADASVHLAALAASYQRAVADVTEAANAARADIGGDIEQLRGIATSEPTRPALIPNIPVEVPPPYVPPPPSGQSHNALIPDTPLVDSPSSNSSAAFDDAPLWQS